MMCPMTEEDTPETLFAITPTPTPEGEDAPVQDRKEAPTFDPKADIVGQTLGEIAVTAKLGAGGMGEVFKGHDTGLDIDVAVKVLPRSLSDNANALSRFQREARMIAKLDHPHVVRVLRVAQESGMHFLSMEYVDGHDVAHQLKTNGKLKFRHALDITRAIADALIHAHRLGLIHRDIKPHNILLDADGQKVKLADFGLARADSERSGMTVSGTILGTPHYMSPEQGEGKTVDARSDIYSLGMTLYHMVTGVVPFRADTPASVLYMQVHKSLEFPVSLFGELPTELPILLMGMCEKDPDKRLSLEDVCGRLDAMIEKSGESSILDVVLKYTSKNISPLRAIPKARTTQRFIYLGVCVVLVMAVVVYFLPGDQSKEKAAQGTGDVHIKDHSELQPPTNGIDYSKLKYFRTLGDHEGSVNYANFSPDGQFFASVGDDRFVRVRTTKDWKLVGGGEIHDKPVRRITNSPDDAYSATSGYSSEAQVYRNDKHMPLFKTPPIKNTPIRVISFSPDNKELLVNGPDERDIILSLPEGIQRTALDNAGNATTAAWSPDGTIIATGYSSGKIKLWRSTDGSQHPYENVMPSYVKTILFPGKERIIALDMQGNLIDMYSVGKDESGHTTHLESKTLKVHGYAYHMALAPDGHTLAIAGGVKDKGDTSSIVIYNITTKKEVTRLENRHRRSIYCVVFSPDGRTLASCGEVGKIILWQVPESASDRANTSPGQSEEDRRIHKEELEGRNRDRTDSGALGNSAEEVLSRIDLRLDQEKLAMFGMSGAEVRRSVEQQIKDQSLFTLEEIRNIRVKVSSTGQFVPLGEIADVTWK